MEGSVFLPLPQGLLITEVCQEGTGLLMKVRSELVSARCPICSQESSLVHSRYQRRLRDVPCGGQMVRLPRLKATSGDKLRILVASIND